MSDARSPAGAACEETEALLVLGRETPAARLRVEGHLSRCLACQQLRERLENTRAVVQAGAPPLDDMRKARMLARLAPALDELAARSARAPGWPRALGSRFERWQLTAAAFVLLAALGAAAMVARTPPRAADGHSSLANGPEGTSALGRSQPLRFEPFQIIGSTGVNPSAGPVGARLETLEVPRGGSVSARLGVRAQVTVVGPARAHVIGGASDLIEVRLDYGTLAADYDHLQGGRLRIRSPDAVTEVVGTLFAVAVDRGQSRVSVSRGRVFVEALGGAKRVVEAGEAWAVGATAAQPIDETTQALLGRHERAIALATPTPSVSALALPARSPSIEPARPTAVPSLAMSPTRPAHGGTSSRRLGREAVAAPAWASGEPSLRSRTATGEMPPVVARVSPARGGAGAPSAQTPEPRVAPPAVAVPLVGGAPAVSVPAVSVPAVSAAPASPPAPPSTATAPLPSAESLYRAAEADMRRRDWHAAELRLEQLANAGTHSALEDVARYELAQLALRSGDRARAAQRLDELLASDREAALREPARFLRCEIQARDRDRAGARRCLEAFRAAHPGSAHDAAALGWLIRLSTPDESCGPRRLLVDEYLRRYEDGSDASEARARKARCPQ